MILERIVRERNISAPKPSTLRKWWRMTDENLHYEVRVQIARHFGDTEREDALTRIMRKVRREGSCVICDDGRYTLSHLVNDITAGLLRDIEIVFGREVADKVSSCL